MEEKKQRIIRRPVDVYCILTANLTEDHKSSPRNMLPYPPVLRRRVRPWTMITGILATTAVLSASGFSPSLSLAPRYRIKIQPVLHASQTVVEEASASAAVEPNDNRSRRKLGDVYVRAVPSTEHDTLPRTSSSSSSSSRRQFRGLTTTNRKRKQNVSVKPHNRFATMPGFATETSGQRAHKDGIRQFERRSGRKHVEAAAEMQQRLIDSGSKLYFNSANAPDSLVQFSRDIQKHGLLTHDEEKSLGAAIQQAIRLQRLHDLLEAKLDREPTDHEWCVAAGKSSIQDINDDIENGRQAKNRLVVSNLRLVMKVVNTYIRKGLSPHYNAADMMQEGILALIRAAEKYEPDRGWKFSTYGMYWIRAAVKEAQVLQSRLIPLPQKLRANCERLVRVEKQLFQALQRGPTREEVSKALGLSEHQVDRCYKAIQVKCYSLDQPRTHGLKPGEQSKTTMADDVDGQVDSGDFAKYNRAFLQEDIIEAMKCHLSAEEVELLLLRYGLKGRSARSGGVATLEELSAIFGVSVQKISTTINRSLRRLQSIGYEEWLPFL